MVDWKNYYYKFKDLFSLKRMLIILSLILIILDIILFRAYISINPNLSLLAQLFGFFSSQAFQFLTISFLLPIILLLIDQIFKINEKRVEEKKSKQIKSIKETQDLWDDLAEITTEFIYLEKFENPKLSSLKMKIEKFIIKVEEALNSRYFEFKNLEKILGKDSYYTATILIPMTILESSISSTITDLIQGRKENICNTQEYIRIIYNGIKAGTHQRTINLMKYSMMLDDSYDNDIKKKILEEYEYLNEFNFALIKEVYDNYKFKDSADDLKDINNFLQEIKYEDLNLKLFRQKFKSLYNELSNQKKINLNDIHEFTPDLIENLAYIIKSYDLYANINNFHDDYMILKKNQ